MVKNIIYTLEPMVSEYLRKNRYSKKDFFQDAISGLSVAIVALPLAMAIAIASNLPPERGLFTAIVAGFLISSLGGSRFQIGGPTAAFIVTVAMVAMKHGYEGLVIATIMSGVMLIVMSLIRAGELIKFIPYPVIVGFTSGIALLILFSQIKDFLGLHIEKMPPDFINKLVLYVQHAGETNFFALFIAVVSIYLIFFFNKRYPKLPSAVIIVSFSALFVWLFEIPVDTIESRFGAIPSLLPAPQFPEITFEQMRELFPDAMTISLLAAIESLLSAVVADGMSGTKHKSNTELFAQGVANIGSSVFGGLPATGAIARTATNIKAGAISPIAGIMHALWLLLFMMLLAPLIVKIPLAALSAILIVVAWNMAEIKNFKSIIKAPLSDIAVLLVTFFLTVLVDLNIAIQAGISLASILFINNMMQTTKIRCYDDEEETDDPDSIVKKIVPQGVEVYELDGPLFFGSAEKLVDTMISFQNIPKVIILRLRHVPMIDAAGLHSLEILHTRLRQNNSVLILSGVHKNVYLYLQRSKLDKTIGEENIVNHIDIALSRAKALIEEV